jgi:hypothetical protein
MPSVAYFRRQADICLRLALLSSDEEVSNRLIMMAREYTAKGEALAKQAGADRSSGGEQGTLPDFGQDDSALRLPPNVPDSAPEC